MILISYDISNNKLRSRFSKFLGKYGHRIQYSVFEIDNSELLLNNVLTIIKTQFEKLFSENDSILIFKLTASCEIIRMGFSKHEENDIIIL